MSPDFTYAVATFVFTNLLYAASRWRDIRRPILIRVWTRRIERAAR